MNNFKLQPPATRGLYHPNNEKDGCGLGFIAHMKGQTSHQITIDALEMLARMDHRGGCGSESNTGDGAGILTNIPDGFFNKKIKSLFNLDLNLGSYAVGNIFLPQDSQQRKYCINVLENAVADSGQNLIGWRDVPIDAITANIGKTAANSQPVIKQIIIGAATGSSDKLFERALFIIRKSASFIIRNDKDLSQALMFYICSLSSKVIVYKGMLIGSQLAPFYPDLQDTDYKSYLAMVHSRFSTNTFPSWDRAQPCRYMSHNGEINTRQGNYNWMRAREGSLVSDVFKDDLNKVLPVIESEVSDSGGLDNVLEFLMMNGRSLQEAVLMTIPEAWQNDTNMSAEKKAFYEYFSNMMEPWDGPASIVFTDGDYIGAVLDRNGLRPSRYYITHDDRVIMASEVGVVDVDSDNIKTKDRLRPGKMFLIDFNQGELIDDEQIKAKFATQNPYQQWLEQQQIHLSALDCATQENNFCPDTLIQRLKAFGYSTEVLQFMLLPLVNELRDPVGSMGNDSALACLSAKPQIIYDYFKQLFAQVTNPAIDSIREEVVMSLRCAIGPEGNLLKNSAENANRLVIEHPILTNSQTSALKNIDHRGWKAKIIDITYNLDENKKISALLTDICKQGSKAIEDGYSIIVLSDRGVNKQRVAISTLLASSALHRHLVAQHQRKQVGIVIETGEAREVHHFCLLTGFGADAINPYLAFEALWQAKRDNMLTGKNDDEIIYAYRKGIAKGMLKVMAKMGISTLESYKGAQVFEAIGLAPEVMDKCFFETASRVKGIGFIMLQQETEKLHIQAYKNNNELDSVGKYHWRSGGEVHMWEPQTIASLQLAARNNDADAYFKFAKHANEEGTKNSTLRGLMSFKVGKPININEVESAQQIVKRFATGAMSFGSISQESHESLAIAMNRLGGKSNTGEGGEDAKRWQLDENGDSRRSAIKQVASGRFGVTIEYLNNADELQIKISQGAKPGEGGELPGPKVDENIARIRHSTIGVGLISPPPHHDIYSIEDLSQLIFDLKRSNPQARISVKLVSEVGVGTVSAGVVKAKADHIVIAGHDGGTGASPLTSIKHAGLPWELGLAETHQTLVMNNLRSRVVVQTDGQLKTGRDVAIAILLGAEEFGFATAPLITMGCIMMRKCHLNTCPVGIATQDTELRKKFSGKPEHVINYLFMVAEDLRLIMAKLGFKSVNEMIGRVDMLETSKINDSCKKASIDLSALLTPAQRSQDATVYHSIAQDHRLDLQLDNMLVAKTKDAIANNSKIIINAAINNVDRAVGAMLSSYIVKTRGANNLSDDTIKIKFSGTAGQSLGAFLAKGVTIEVEGDANDYVGKGLSGGIIAVYPPKNSTFNSADEIIAGNVCGYGATGGEMYLSGRVAERFCVRNSGLIAVVEGVGDHGCEYMTGGRAIILGEVGRNFAAGMSGGISYVYNPHNTLENMCNMAMIDLDPMDNEAQTELKKYLLKHFNVTNSNIAKHILDNWQIELQNFTKVMPKDFKLALAKSA